MTPTSTSTPTSTAYTLQDILDHIADIQTRCGCTRESAFFLLRKLNADEFDALGDLLRAEADGHSSRRRRRGTRAA